MQGTFHTGAKSGKTRVNPLMYLADRDRLLVFATKEGAPTHHDWFHNLSANPATTVEVGADKFAVEAEELTTISLVSGTAPSNDR